MFASLRWSARPQVISFAGIITLLLLTACFSSRPSAHAQGDPYLINADELEASPHNNLYDAVRQLRPGWFRRAGTTGDQRIIVYLDDQQVGGVATLSRFTTRSIAEVRYLTPTEAQVRYGQINLGRPAIQLQSMH